MESLATQILVVFVIRTQHVPFFKSKPSPKLVFSTLACLTIGWVLPYLPFVSKLGFEALPGLAVFYISGLELIYLLFAEIAKRSIYTYLGKYS